MDEVLRALMTESPHPAATADVDAWWHLHLDAPRGRAPIDHALRAAFRMDRLAWVFASGYQAALAALVPEVADLRVALCATEEGGNHPRAIETRLEPEGDGFRLTGSKVWTTLGTRAQSLLVVATEGMGDDGRPRLRVARVPADRAGVRVEDGPEARFVPEITHARTELEGVRVEAEELLPGDGWTDVVKPFRTVEDAHVHGAVLAYLLQVGRRSRWPEGLLARALAAIVTARTIALAPPSSEATHVALGGLLATTHALIEEAAPGWASVEPAVRARFERDAPLLGVAGKARARRLEVAFERLRA